MKIEIWSDIVCPFCYIGKRRLEAALAEFGHKEEVEIEWKSFQLSPYLKTDPAKNSNQFLAEHKGISIAEAEHLHERVTAMAATAGLNYRFDKAVVANSFNAHRLLHFAKSKGLQNELEELIFKAYFTEGKNIDDYPTLVDLAAAAGLDGAEAKAALDSNAYADDVKADVMQAQEFGINGVPFFVFNRKYAVSGAQDAAVFLQTLQAANQK